jgi:hypothetical protein
VAQLWAFGTASSVQTAGTVTSLTCNAPASLADGDLLVAVAMYDASSTLTLPTGWAHVTGSPQTTSPDLRASMIWKKASGEPSSYAFAVTGGGHIFTVAMARWTGIQASPFDISAAAGATASTISAPTVTTTATDDLVVRGVATWNATTVTFASGTSRVLAGTGGDLVRIADQNQSTAGATGTNVATANTGNEMAAFTAAFKQSSTPTLHTVTGSGSFSIGASVALEITLTGIPAACGTGKGNPVRYFDLGNIAWATSHGTLRNFYLEHAHELVLAPASGFTTIYYSLQSGITAVIQELSAI